MQTLPLSQVQNRLPALLKDVGGAREIAIAEDGSEETLAVVVPYAVWKKSRERTLGSLEGKASVRFEDDFAMTEEELLGGARASPETAR